MKCKKCGTELAEGVMFCPECGAKNEPEVDANISQGGSKFCPQCGNQVDAAAVFCGNCGFSFTNVEQAPQMEQSQPQGGTKFCPQCGNQVDAAAEFCGMCGFSFVSETPNPAASKPKFNLKKILPIAIAAVVVVAVVGILVKVVIPNISSSSKGSEGGIEKLVYIKDNQINLCNESKVQIIDDDFYDDKTQVEYDTSSKPIQFSENGKYMFYPVDYTYSGTYDLYRTKVGSKKNESEKIDSDVSSYYVLSDSKVIYLKDDKLSLSTISDKQKISSNVKSFKVINDNKYICWKNKDNEIYVQDVSLKNDKVKVATDVDYFRISEDEKYILWVTDDNVAYVIDSTAKKEKQKIASDVTGLLYCADDYSKIIYQDVDALYLISNFGDKQKIDDDVNGAYVYTNDDTNKEILYYSKLDVDSYTIGDFINDDMESQDKNNDSYDAQLRNGTRDFFDTKVEISACEYYYYDISKAKGDLITTLPGSDGYDGISSIASFSTDTSSSTDSSSDDSENYVISISGIDCNKSGGVTVAKYYDMDEVGKIKFSEFCDEYSWYYDTDFYRYIASEIRTLLAESDKKMCAIVENTLVELDAEDYADYTNIYGRASKNMLYLSISNGEDKYDYTVVSTNLSKDNGKFTEISDEVDRIVKIRDSGIYYLCDVGDSSKEGDLYLNDSKIAEDVYMNLIDFYDTDSFFYASDKGDDDYTLMMYNGKKAAKISDDVYDYLQLEDGSVAFLYDFSTKRYEGDLKLYDNGKIKDIDTDVSAIVRY